MATFPPIGDLERDAALARIERRHLAHDDYRWSEAGSDARDVLSYLRAHRSRLPARVRADDVWDELVLSAWTYWDDRRRERELLRHALSQGLSLREVGAFVGLHTGQGLRDYLDSLEARLHEHRELTTEARSPRDPPSGRALIHDDESSTEPQPDHRSDHRNDHRTHDETDAWAAPGPRAMRSMGADPEAVEPDREVSRRSRNPYLRFQGRSRAVRGADGRYARNRRTAAAARPARQIWIEHHDRRIRDVLGALLDEAERLGLPAEGSDDHEPDLGDYLEWVSEDLNSGIDHGTFGSVGLALGLLRTAPVVTERAPNHGVRRAIAAADRLRADYAALTPTRASP